MSANKERITRVTLEEAKRMKGKTDYARLDAMTDEDIARAVADDPDAVPVDADWSDAVLVIPPNEQDKMLRVDDDVAEWFRASGGDYRGRMNDALRGYMKAHRRKTG